MKIFSFFALKKVQRKKVEEPKDLITWFKHGLSEFFGTLLLSFSLAGLSIIVAGSHKAVEVYFLSPFVIGFYAGLVAVGAVLLIFLRWSCDLNPAVTMTRLLNGTNTWRYGVYKIVIQFIAGVAAGFIIYGFGTLGNGLDGKPDVVNHAISATKVAEGTFFSAKHLDLYNNNLTAKIAGGSTLIFFSEMLTTSMLLFPIFSKMINDKYRHYAIMFIISMVIWMGLLTHTAAVNPARGLAQQIPALVFGPEYGNSASLGDLLASTFTMLFGGMAASFFYVFCQGLTEHYVSPTVNWIIEWKNNRSQGMAIRPPKIVSNNKKVETKKTITKPVTKQTVKTTPKPTAKTVIKDEVKK